ncbi:uncharacterized protein BDZ99DRAFT_467351 [Mytilinidion resinicola]|uniref:Uncharacterized protein n=1 Tax=Mytilinidion resinicola TaxID=574789 RepID=A0A6A6YA14_9PEZI|nr:uncharacterized protein BDZ99DRAFT_467351 [Mytilinidion resinicola]KAF2804667.1 hypothetical protein BDZ99DRAFT_467351 [Mytilinidion resinicola]
MTLLPKTVKKILIDLTMPSEPLKALEELFPLNTVQFAAPPPRALEDFWVKLIMKLRERIETLARNLITAGRGEKRVHQAITVGTTEVALKSMGFFPQSQVKAMLHSTQPIWRTYCLQWHSAASMSFFESYFPGLRSSRDHWRGMLAKMQRDRERSLRVLHREVKKEQQAKEYEKKKAKEYEEKKAKEYEEKKAGRK